MLKRHTLRKNRVASVVGYRSPVVDPTTRVRRTTKRVQSLDAFSILTERRKVNPNLKPKKRKLTVEEKLALAKKIAGSAKFMTKEGHAEAHRIANREDWED